MLYTGIRTVIIVLLLVLISCSNQSSQDSGAVKIALREVGNQLLLRNQDSTSIIKPIIEIDEHKFVLQFQNDLSFEPNELVTIIDINFNVMDLSHNYRVEVLQCIDQEVAYSYEMNEDNKRTIIPCAGRHLTKDCYSIEILFSNQSSKLSIGYLVLIAIIFMLLGGLIFYFRMLSTSNKKLPNEDQTYEQIGSFKFYREQSKLARAAIEINLSRKECELLALFVANPNQVIKRDELTKKVWEDHGVIVGRSLDTYISKLRKKLRDDNSVKLTNVHGIGYKLETS